MNTIVGMQASLHDSLNDNMNDLTKSGKDSTFEGISASMFEDEEFDPDELLKSDMFNNSDTYLDNSTKSFSHEDSFGTFGNDNLPTAYSGSPSGRYTQPKPTVTPVSSYPSSFSSNDAYPTKMNGMDNPMNTSLDMILTPNPINFSNNHQNQQNTMDISDNTGYSMNSQMNNNINEPPMDNNGRYMGGGNNNLLAMQNSLHDNDMSGGRHLPSRSISYDDQGGFQRGVPNRSASLNSYTGQGYRGMRMGQQSRGTSDGLSQTVHGDMLDGHSGFGRSMNGSDPLGSSSFHGGNQSLSSSSYHGPPIRSAPMRATSLNAGYGMDSSGHNQNGGNVNDAMAMLCQTMKRSAMSRQMVKQLSGRGLMKQGSARQLLAQQRIGGSDHLMMDTSSGRGAAPIRRAMPDAKHRIQRGVYRHDSQGSPNGLGGHSGHGNINLQFDGRNMGPF